MFIRDWFLRRRSGHEVAAWAAEIARRCHCEVALRLDQAMYGMSLPQARGYIRSRAAAVLEQELALVIEGKQFKPALLVAVREHASEQVVRMAIGDLLKISRHAACHRKAA